MSKCEYHTNKAVVASKQPIFGMREYRYAVV